MFNTRSETASEKPMFSDGIARRRCLIPALLYYEWQKTNDGKIKYEIAPEYANGFFLAGIYRLEGKSPVFSVLTILPVPSISFIHDRMPVILPQEAMSDWLNPRYHGSEILSAAGTSMAFKPSSENFDSLVNQKIK